MIDLIDSLIQGNEKAAQQLLLCSQVDPNVADDWFNATPLHYSVLYKRTNVIPLLICAGADRYAKDAEGRTPFDLAVELNHTKEASILLWPEKIFEMQRVFIKLLLNGRSFASIIFGLLVLIYQLKNIK